MAINAPRGRSIDGYFSKRSSTDARGEPSSEVVKLLRVSPSAGSLAASARVKMFCIHG